MENLQKNPEKSFRENKTIETIKNLEAKAKLVFGVLAISFMSSFSNQAEAQNFKMNKEGYEIDSTTMEVRNPKDTLNPSIYADTRAETVRQRKQILKYIRSPKYRERMAREYFWFKKMSKIGYSEEAFKGMPEMNRIDKDEQGDTLRIFNMFENYVTQWKDSSEVDLTEALKLENIFPKPDLNTLTPEDWETIDMLINSRLENVKNGRWIIAFWPDENTKGAYYPKLYKTFFKTSDTTTTNIPLSALVFLRDSEEGESEISNTATHEILGHQSDDGGSEMNRFIKYLLDWKGHSGDDYLDSPTEIYARISSFRENLVRVGLYDPCTEDFTLEILKKVLELPEYIQIKEDSDFKQLMKTVDQSVIIWLMNNIADVDIIIRFDENGRLKGINDIFFPDLGNQTATG